MCFDFETQLKIEKTYSLSRTRHSTVFVLATILAVRKSVLRRACIQFEQILKSLIVLISIFIWKQSSFWNNCYLLSKIISARQKSNFLFLGLIWKGKETLTQTSTRIFFGLSKLFFVRKYFLKGYQSVGYKRANSKINYALNYAWYHFCAFLQDWRLTDLPISWWP